MTVLELVQHMCPHIFYCYDINTGRINRCVLDKWEKYTSYNYFKNKQVVRYGKGFSPLIGDKGFYIYCT